MACAGFYRVWSGGPLHFGQDQNQDYSMPTGFVKKEIKTQNQRITENMPHRKQTSPFGQLNVIYAQEKRL